jgi:hypothetical protein
VEGVWLGECVWIVVVEVDEPIVCGYKEKGRGVILTTRRIESKTKAVSITT